MFRRLPPNTWNLVSAISLESTGSEPSRVLQRFQGFRPFFWSDDLHSTVSWVLCELLKHDRVLEYIEMSLFTWPCHYPVATQCSVLRLSAEKQSVNDLLTSRSPVVLLTMCGSRSKGRVVTPSPSLARLLSSYVHFLCVNVVRCVMCHQCKSVQSDGASGVCAHTCSYRLLMLQISESSGSRLDIHVFQWNFELDTRKNNLNVALPWL